MRSESSIQRAVIGYAKKRGCLCKKLSVQGPMGNSGWPDFMVVPKHRPIFFVEFKREGGALTPLQEQTKKLIEDCGVPYFVVDDVEQGKRLIDGRLET